MLRHASATLVGLMLLGGEVGAQVIDYSTASEDFTAFLMKHPRAKAFIEGLKVGDLVFVDGNGWISDLSGSRWLHTVMVVKEAKRRTLPATWWFYPTGWHPQQAGWNWHNEDVWYWNNGWMRHASSWSANAWCWHDAGEYYHYTGGWLWSSRDEVTAPIVIQAEGSRVRWTRWSESSDAYSTDPDWGTYNRFNGVAATSLTEMMRWYMRQNTTFRAVRPTTDANAIAKAFNFANSKIGKPYDYTFNVLANNDRYYCSELVRDAYASAGVTLNTVSHGGGKGGAIATLVDALKGLGADDVATNDAIAYSWVGLGGRAKDESWVRDYTDYLVNFTYPRTTRLKQLLDTGSHAERVLRKLTEEALRKAVGLANKIPQPDDWKDAVECANPADRLVDFFDTCTSGYNRVEAFVKHIELDWVTFDKFAPYDKAAPTWDSSYVRSLGVKPLTAEYLGGAAKVSYDPPLCVSNSECYFGYVYTPGSYSWLKPQNALSCEGDPSACNRYYNYVRSFRSQKAAYLKGLEEHLASVRDSACQARDRFCDGFGFCIIPARVELGYGISVGEDCGANSHAPGITKTSNSILDMLVNAAGKASGPGALTGIVSPGAIADAYAAVATDVVLSRDGSP